MDFVVVDLEATGLDTETVDVHCVVMQEPGSAADSFYPQREDIEDACGYLNELIERGYTLAGHNIIEYDIPILRRYGLNDPGPVYDTLVVSRAAKPGNQLYQEDQRYLIKNPHLRGTLKPGAHSLKAWGLRLGEYKDDYDGGWEVFSEEMLQYCVQDVAVNVELFELLRDRIPDEAAILECQVAQICRDMRLVGVGFDQEAAVTLAAELAGEREQLAKSLREIFPPWYVAGKVKTPKRSSQSRAKGPGEAGYINVEEGCSHQAVVLTEFNPASNEHIADRLQNRYGWKPQHYTPTGKPQVTAEVLNDLPYPEAPLLARYKEIQKVVGYIAEGTSSWLKLEEAGRIHGKVNPTGTVSGRASHSRPNTGNVPSRSQLGHQCRALFRPAPGKVMVGADASGLQLRILAHYLAKWDGGVFARQCEDGDIHEYMRAATGLNLRSYQKTWTYAKLFGAGPGKLGQTAIADHRAALAEGLIDTPAPQQQQARSLGEQTLTNLGDAIPAFNELAAGLRDAANEGWLRTLDGRRLPISSEHIAIAMLLQGGEAVVMKRAMQLARPAMIPFKADFVLWVHDEFQVECDPDVADDVGAHLVECMLAAGEYYDLRVRIDGEFKVGETWAETH